MTQRTTTRDGPPDKGQAGSSSSVLVVDDEEDVCALVKWLLESEGFSVQTATNGQDGLRTFFSWQPDLAILDVRMPRMDGWELLGRIREMSDAPVIMLTALGEEEQIVRGLGGGADDYLAKPFGNSELVARVKAVLRRVGQPSELHEPYADAAIHLDYQQHRVHVRGDEKKLTPLEYRVLLTLVRNAGEVISVDRILDECWGDRLGGPLNVRLYINYVRKKIEEDPSKPKLIETVREFGYRYRPPAEPR